MDPRWKPSRLARAFTLLGRCEESVRIFWGSHGPMAATRGLTVVPSETSFRVKTPTNTHTLYVHCIYIYTYIHIYIYIYIYIIYTYIHIYIYTYIHIYIYNYMLHTHIHIRHSRYTCGSPAPGFHQPSTSPMLCWLSPTRTHPRGQDRISADGPEASTPEALAY